MKKFKSILQLIKEFPDEVSCQQYLAELRWNNAPECPKCGNTKIYKFSNGKTFKCSGCLVKFNARTGSIFEDSKIPLQTWFIAVYLLTSHKKGISSLQLGRDLNVTQKTAWFMLHRLRYAFQTQSFTKPLEGVIELDESFVGGKNKNRHKDKKVENSQGRSFKDKTPVFGIMQRSGQVKAFKVADTSSKTLEPIIIKNVSEEATIMSDEWKAYTKLHLMYNHYVIRHDQGQYVDGDVHVNTLEGFWSLMKRSIIGIYHYISPKHLEKYLSEYEFRYNSRKITEQQRMEQMLMFSNGRLMYKELTAPANTTLNEQKEEGSQIG